MRQFCSLCSMVLEEVEGHPFNYYCEGCSVWYKSHYGALSIAFSKPPWTVQTGLKYAPTVGSALAGPQQIGANQSGIMEDDISEAQKRWMEDTVIQMTNDPKRVKALYQIMRKLFMGQADFWDITHDLRRETGLHIDDIFAKMRHAMQLNPQALREVEAEGVELPFMPPKEKKKSTNYAALRGK